MTENADSLVSPALYGQNESTPSGSQETLESHYSGVIGFARLLMRFLPYALSYWDKMLLRVLYRLAHTVVSILSALITVRIVDDGILEKDLYHFVLWSGAKFVLTTHILVFIIIYANICHYILLRLNIVFKRLLFDHVQRMHLAFHQSRPIGENMYRINNDTEVATGFVANAVPEVLESVAEMLVTVSVVLAVSPTVVGLVWFYILVYFFYSHVVVGWIYKAQQYTRKAEQRVAAILQECFTAFFLTKSLALERLVRYRYFNRLKEVMRARLAFFSLLSAWREGGEFLQSFFVGAITHTIVCGYFVIIGKMTTGQFMAMFEMIALIQNPLFALMSTIQRLRVDAVPAQRMLETLDIVPSIQSKANAIKLTNPLGRVQFEDVWFRYGNDGEDVLKGISFGVAPGQKVAIVGVSGAGKTSLFNLLMRFCDPTRGRVLIDGYDLKDIDLESYRQHVSVVLQENFVFSATIRDNMLIGNPGATEDELLKAIQRAGLEPLVQSLPKGLDTELLEGGNLSMGERQRIAIARVLIRNPKFLYLDEATSSLDPLTEIEVLAQLNEAARGRTCLVIAHHIVSVQDADLILVMQQGEIVQCGKHTDLIRDTQGVYAGLWAAELHKHASPNTFSQGHIR
ncbi:MAG TPA: ABC transporter ATP-binding protein [Candidatus Hydrogenedentes bacterium]|nr:ABC transporter ATP-binding protein [Candidatus Hydrogenedentota bacterium]HOL77271.1 ABC transporter ATP-binding protein [Candidatus Hydrogenedentota bacterium]HPO86563.1 ABC transporter ATP-binding protein [Candidatus Hydrogenedentota bacterium]